MTAKQLIAARPDLLTEKELSGLVVEVARLAGWTLRYHTLTSRGSAHGFPDWVLVHPQQVRIIFAELKSEKGKLTDAQKEWRLALRLLSDWSLAQFYRGGPGNMHRFFEYHWWRPSDWDDIVETLTGRRPVNKPG